MADPKPPRTGVDTVVDRILENEKQTRLLSSASGTQRNRVLADLVGRVSRVARDVNAFESWTRTDGGDSQTFLTNVPFGPVVEFGLAERRLVRVVTTLSVTISFTSYDSNRYGSAGIDSTSIIDGTFGEFADETDALFIDVAAGPPVTRVGSGQKRLRVERYLDLGAGAHTAQAALRSVQITPTGTGTAWNSYLTASAAFVAVDVLQTLD